MLNGIKENRCDKLRTALAINRGIEFLSTFRAVSNVTQTQWGSYLEDLYRQVYSHMFADTAPVSPQQRLVGLVSSAQKAYVIGEAFHDFTNRFFDKNGFFISTNREENARWLAELFYRLEKEQPFSHHNSLVLRVFFTAMGRMRGFREKLNGIDFRRLSNNEAEAFVDKQRTIDDLARVFSASMDPARDPVYPSEVPPHFTWDDRSVSIYGKRFIRADRQRTPLDLWKSIEPDEELIVLTNGHLVTESYFCTALAKHMEEGMFLGSLRIGPEHYCGRLANLGNDINGELITSKKVVDYIDVTNGAPPICMNLHPLSMLTRTQHHRLETYLKTEFNARVTDLSDPVLAKAVRHSVKGYPRAETMLDIAVVRLTNIVNSMKQSIEDELSKKKQAHVSSGQPEMVMTMGGSGSGKGSNLYFNSRYRNRDGTPNEKYIYASLDDGRPYSDVYHVLVASGHHADDYEAVHAWADTRRNWLCDRARERHYNLIYDGSGIQYAGRYDKIVRDFEKSGYHTTIVAADCYLIRRTDRSGTVGAIDRIMQRAGYLPDGTPLPAHLGPYRTLPWRVAINKHIDFPSSFFAALAESASPQNGAGR